MGHRIAKGDIAIGVIALVFIAGWVAGMIQTNRKQNREPIQIVSGVVQP